MGFETGFRKPGWPRLPGLVHDEFWEAVRSGLSPTAAATVAGVCGATGRKWAKEAGHQTDTKHRGIRYSPVESGCVLAGSACAGESPACAAMIAGVSENAARQWLQQAGYVPRTPVPADTGTNAPVAAERADVVYRALSVGAVAGDEDTHRRRPPGCWGGIGTRFAARSPVGRPVRGIGRGWVRTWPKPTSSALNRATWRSQPPVAVGRGGGTLGAAA